MTTTTGQVLLLDRTAQVKNGMAFTPDGTALILDDGRCFTEDTFAKLDQTTGNVLTILDPLHDTNYSVVTDVVFAGNNFYTYDATSYPAQVGDKTFCYTLDYFAYIDPNTGAVYTTDGEDVLPSSPIIAGAALEQAKPIVQPAQPQIPTSVSTTTGQVLLLDRTAQVKNGMAFTPDGTALILDDGRCFTEDTFAKLDQTTGNVLTILDPLHDTNYSVVTDVVFAGNKFYTYDATSYPAQVGDKTFCYTLDYFAYIDPNTGAVYTTDGEDVLPSSPIIAGAALEQAKPIVQQTESQTEQQSEQQLTEESTDAPNATLKSVVVKGQHVKDNNGRDLILLDPSAQPYSVVLVDVDEMSLTKF